MVSDDWASVAPSVACTATSDLTVDSANPSEDSPVTSRNCPLAHHYDVVPEHRPQTQRRVSFFHFLVILGCIALPNVVLTVCLSDIGMGLEVYSITAPARVSLVGSALIAICLLAFCVLYVADWAAWESCLARVAAVAPAACLLTLGACLKCSDYPEAPVVVVLLQVPIAIFALRMAFWKVRHSSFCFVVSASLAVVAVALLALWLIWMNTEAVDGKTHRWNSETKAALAAASINLYRERRVNIAGEMVSLVYSIDCNPETKRRWRFTSKRVWHQLTSQEEDARAEACGKVATAWFLAWMSPFVASLVNLTIAVFLMISGVYPGREDLSRLERALKWFTCSVSAMILMMWLAASIAGASMRLTSTIMAFCVLGILFLCIWIYLEMRPEVIALTKSSGRLQMLVSLPTSDWFWAMAIIGLNGLMPAVLALELLKQKLRKLRGVTHRGDPMLTPWVHRIFVAVQNRSLVSILSKVNILCQAFFVLSIGVAKGTFVFLSWLNETLLELELGVVISVFFIVGFLLLMAPPVPGIPVYVCSGIVISARAKHTDWGYGLGVGIAVAVSFVLKLTAVVGQYLVGYVLGKSVKIQQLVRVDKVATRAVERILEGNGFTLPKVAVLVGGPDWPTSVLCGILKLNLVQCIVGTVPVIFVSSPCVIAGALMVAKSRYIVATSKELPVTAAEGEEHQDAFWDALASTFLGISAICQLASGVLALYFILDVVLANREELAVHRPEHDAVLQLTKRERAYAMAYLKVTEWRRLSRLLRAMLLGATGLAVLCLFVFMVLDTRCFRPFQVSSRIGNPLDEGGLGGDVRNLVLWPGRLVLAVHGVALMLYVTFILRVHNLARKQLNALGPEPC